MLIKLKTIINKLGNLLLRPAKTGLSRLLMHSHNLLTHQERFNTCLMAYQAGIRGSTPNSENARIQAVVTVGLLSGSAFS